MLKQVVQKSDYLLNPIVDDYNIRDLDFYKRAEKMKHISAHTDLRSEWVKQFAWLPKRSDITNEFIWLTTYWEYVIKMDTYGYEPRTDTQWKLIYTRNEYIQKKLFGEIENE